MSNLSHDRRSAIVSFAVPSGVDEAHHKLTNAGIIVAKREDVIRVLLQHGGGGPAYRLGAWRYTPVGRLREGL